MAAANQLGMGYANLHEAIDSDQKVEYWFKNSVDVTAELLENAVMNEHSPKRCKTSSVGQSAGILISRSSVRTPKNREFKFTWI